MPELPEVETIAGQLRNGRSGSACIPPLIGRTIQETRVLWAREISGLSAKAFERQTRGARVNAVSRHGKYLIIELSAPPSQPETKTRRRLPNSFAQSRQGSPQSLRAEPSEQSPISNLQSPISNPPLFMLIHLRMSGRLEVVAQAEAFSKHARVVWLLDEGWALRFDDARKFGRVWLVDDAAAVIGRIGPDALLISGDDFAARLLSKRRALKPLLLDQAFIAGVGNIYADESLFLARLHPKRLTHTLSGDDARRLHAAIQQVLRAGVEANGASFDWVYPGGNYQDNFYVYGRTGEPCSNCGQPIVRILVGQRSTHFCAHCQLMAP